MKEDKREEPVDELDSYVKKSDYWDKYVEV